MKGLLISAALCITLFLAGYVLIAQEELSEDVKSIAKIVMVITPVAFCIIIVKMITLKRLIIMTALCAILILVGYALIPEKVKPELPEWVNTLVGIAFYTVFSVIYIALSLIGAIIELAEKALRVVDSLLRPDNADRKQCDKWSND